MKLGRKPRLHDPRVPHLSAMLAGVGPLPVVPVSKDWTEGMPNNFGMMLNDQLGDCTCAAIYHGIQVWTQNAQAHRLTEPDYWVERLYEKAAGYVLGNPDTDNGAAEQDILNYFLNKGVPTGPHAKPYNLLAAYFEVDPRNHDDIKRTIYDCGFTYIGFNVPKYLMEDIPAVWDVAPASRDHGSDGGHAVIAAGYDDTGLTVISWGQRFKMTWAFWDLYVEEAYGLVNLAWIEQNGSSPAGMTIDQLKEQMRAIAKPPFMGLRLFKR